MKIQLTINLELPDRYDGCTDEEVCSLLHSEYVVLPEFCHLDQAMTLASRNEPNDAMSEAALEDHKEWIQICKNLTYSVALERTN
jgi:hypothetical protein